MTRYIMGVAPDEIKAQSPESRDKQTLAQMQQRSEKSAALLSILSAATGRFGFTYFETG
jgi:hypothetical protein